MQAIQLVIIGNDLLRMPHQICRLFNLFGASTDIFGNLTPHKRTYECFLGFTNSEEERQLQKNATNLSGNQILSFQIQQ